MAVSYAAGDVVSFVIAARRERFVFYICPVYFKNSVLRGNVPRMPYGKKLRVKNIKAASADTDVSEVKAPFFKKRVYAVCSLQLENVCT